jgi:ribosomal protein L7/L12
MSTLSNEELNERFSRVAQAIARLERKTDFILKELKLEYIDQPDSGIPPQLAEVYALLKQGKKLQAIQAYRKLTNASYDQAKEAVENLELGSVG